MSDFDAASILAQGGSRPLGRGRETLALEQHRQFLLHSPIAFGDAAWRTKQPLQICCELVSDLRSVQGSLARRALRDRHTESCSIRWQAETFGFHLAELEVRQHSGVHAQAWPKSSRTKRCRLRRGSGRHARVMASVQGRFGRRHAGATSSASPRSRDISRLQLAEHATGGTAPLLDVVPLSRQSKTARSTEGLGEISAWRP